MAAIVTQNQTRIFRECLLDDVRYSHRWPSDTRFPEGVWFWLSRLNGMAGAW